MPPLLAASVAWAQVPVTEADMEWRKSPRPAIESNERHQHSGSGQKQR